MKTNYPISSLLHQKSTRVWCISPEATVYDAIKFMAEKNIGALPVMSDGKLLGIFTERDYTRKVALAGKTSRETTVFEILSDVCETVTPDDSVEDCMRLMTEKRVRHLPVIEEGRLAGIITIGDVVKARLEETTLQVDSLREYVMTAH